MLKPLDKLWTNLNIATMAPPKGTGDHAPYGFIENGSIGVIGDKIAYIGDLNTIEDHILPDPPHIFNMDGKLATPGLIDCHTHIIYGGNRAEEFEMRLKGTSYSDIAKAGGGINSTVAHTRNASPAELFAESFNRITGLMDEGVTTIEIKSGYGLNLESERAMLEAAQMAEANLDIRVQKTCLAAHALPTEFEGRADAYIAHICDDILPTLHNEGLVDAVDGFCEDIAFSTDQMRKVFERAKHLGIPIKLHAEQLSDLGGAGLAADFNALSADHLEFVSSDSLDKMAKAGTVAVLLPGAFYVLKESQVPPVGAMRDRGIPIAIASDANPGSSPVGSLRLMLNMACTSFGLTPEEALAGITLNAAKALGMQDSVGSLEVGKLADIAIWDLKHPAELSYWLGGNPNSMTIFGGEELG
jgi:imidazolonepropionase